jgi:Uma2 family endonuclease
LTERHGPWTVDELHRLPDDEHNRYEIDDGVLIVSPRPASSHQAALLEIAVLLREPARAAGLEVLPEVEVFTARRDDWLKVPDIAVVTWEAFDCEPQEYEAADVALVVEISGTGQSARRDFGEKLSAYADAGIRHYWVLELTPASKLTVFELVGTEYKQVASSRELIELTRPFPVEIDPGRLTRPRRG